MSTTPNPYQAPLAKPQVPQQVGGAYIGRENDQLVVQHGAQLPMFCVKTNEPATEIVKRTFYWHHPMIFLVVLASPLLYVIIALILRKKMIVNIPLSKVVAAKRGKNLLLVRTLMILSIAVVILGFYFIFTEQRALALLAVGLIILGFISLVGFAIANQMISSIIKPKKITDQHGWFTKAHPQYLDRLTPPPSNYQQAK